MYAVIKMFHVEHGNGQIRLNKKGIPYGMPFKIQNKGGLRLLKDVNDARVVCRLFRF